MDTYTYNINLLFTRLMFCLVGIVVTNSVCAQQQIHYTQFLSNKLWINPAYAGSHGHGSIQGIARNQWIGLDGAPKTAAISFHTPSKKFRTGVGLGMTYDKIGPTTAYALSGSYAYVLYKRSGRRLSIGLQGAYTWWDLDFTEIETTIQGDGSFAINPESLSWLNFGAGIFYHSRKSFIGFSVPRLLQRTFYDFNSQDLQARFEQHWYLMGGNVFRLNPDVELNVGALFKYVKYTPLDLDVSAILIFKEKLWTGVNWRMGNRSRSIGTESIDFIVQYQLSDNLRLGLAYDYTLTALSDVNSGSLELLTHWDMIKHYKNVKSIRYF